MRLFNANALLCFLLAGVQVTLSAPPNRSFNATELHLIRSNIVALEQRYTYDATYARNLASLNQEFLEQAKNNARALLELTLDFEAALRLVQEHRLTIERFINSTVT